MEKEIQQNNFAEEKLNGKFKVKVTYDNNNYLLEIVNHTKTILRKETNKDILQNNAIKNDLVIFIVDNKIIERRNEAREH